MDPIATQLMLDWLRDQVFTLNRKVAELEKYTKKIGCTGGIACTGCYNPKCPNDKYQAAVYVDDFVGKKFCLCESNRTCLCE